MQRLPFPSLCLDGVLSACAQTRRPAKKEKRLGLAVRRLTYVLAFHIKGQNMVSRPAAGLTFLLARSA